MHGLCQVVDVVAGVEEREREENAQPSMKIDDNDDKIHKKGQKKYTSAKHTHPEKEKVSEKRPQDDFFLSLSHKRYAKSGIETNTAQH